MTPIREERKSGLYGEGKMRSGAFVWSKNEYGLNCLKQGVGKGEKPVMKKLEVSRSQRNVILKAGN